MQNNKDSYEAVETVRNPVTDRSKHPICTNLGAVGQIVWAMVANSKLPTTPTCIAMMEA